MQTIYVDKNQEKERAGSNAFVQLSLSLLKDLLVPS
jgi:hypothetical protein